MYFTKINYALVPTNELFWRRAMLLSATDLLLPGTWNGLGEENKKSEFASPQQKSLASPEDSEVSLKFFNSGLTTAYFSPLQGKREDKASHCSPETEGGREGS